MQAPSPSLVVRVYGGLPFYEAKFRHDGRQVKRRIGPAWVERDQHGWRKRPGRVPDDAFDERRAHAAAAAAIVAGYIDDAAEELRRAREREARHHVPRARGRVHRLVA
ncbi:MAG: hypothetical protein ACLP0J_10550 [Solirubrobacteraceae bacterium]